MVMVVAVEYQVAYQVYVSAAYSASGLTAWRRTQRIDSASWISCALSPGLGRPQELWVSLVDMGTLLLRFWRSQLVHWVECTRLWTWR